MWWAQPNHRQRLAIVGVVRLYAGGLAFRQCAARPWRDSTVAYCVACRDLRSPPFGILFLVVRGKRRFPPEPAPTVVGPDVLYVFRAVHGNSSAHACLALRRARCIELIGRFVGRAAAAVAPNAHQNGISSSVSSNLPAGARAGFFSAAGAARWLSFSASLRSRWLFSPRASSWALVPSICIWSTRISVV